MYQYVMQLNGAERDYIYESSLESVGRALDNFYEYMADKDYNFGEAADNEVTRQTLQQIQDRVEALLQVYCGFTEEEVAQLEDLSSAKRMV